MTCPRGSTACASPCSSCISRNGGSPEAGKPLFEKVVDAFEAARGERPRPRFPLFAGPGNLAAGSAADAARLDAKLDVFDRYAEQAVAELVAWLTEHGGDLIAVARGRHVAGHYLYGDGNFLEYDDGRLLAETAEEIADAIVYQSRQIKRREEGGR